MAQDDNSANGDASTPDQRQEEAVTVTPGQSEIKAETGRDKWCRYFSKPKNRISFLTLIAVSIYTGITLFLWCNSNEQVKVSRDTEERQLRAYVIVNKVQAITYGGREDGINGPLWALYPIIENTGATPTKELLIQGLEVLGTKEQWFAMKNFPWRDPSGITGKHAVLGPKDETLGTGSYTGATDLDQMSRGILRSEMSGLVTYHDVFGHRHRTEYCMALTFPRADYANYAIGQAIRSNGTPCPQHNCTDEECDAQ